MQNLHSNSFFELTPAFRAALQARRLQLGLSFHQLAHFFGIDYTTLLCWEHGTTYSCAAKYAHLLRHFTEGAYDHVIHAALLFCGKDIPSPAAIPIELLSALTALSNALLPSPASSFPSLKPLVATILHLYIWEG